jgi:hypothetical protein
LLCACAEHRPSLHSGNREVGTESVVAVDVIWTCSACETADQHRAVRIPELLDLSVHQPWAALERVPADREPQTGRAGEGENCVRGE